MGGGKKQVDFKVIRRLVERSVSQAAGVLLLFLLCTPLMILRLGQLIKIPRHTEREKKKKLCYKTIVLSTVTARQSKRVETATAPS